MTARSNVVLITGCSSGIGRATARTFNDNGWRVWATARDPSDIGALGEAGCITAGLDVTDGDLRMEAGSFGVDVVLVEPGTVKTRFERRTRETAAGFTPEPVYEDASK